MSWTKVEDGLPTETKRYLVYVLLPGQIKPTREIAKRYKHHKDLPTTGNIRKLDPNFIIFGKVLQWCELPDEPKN